MDHVLAWGPCVLALDPCPCPGLMYLSWTCPCPGPKSISWSWTFALVLACPMFRKSVVMEKVKGRVKEREEEGIGSISASGPRPGLRSMCFGLGPISLPWENVVFVGPCPGPKSITWSRTFALVLACPMFRKSAARPLLGGGGKAVACAPWFLLYYMKCPPWCLIVY